LLIDEIIFFYKSFDKYKNKTYQELYYYLIHNYNHNQFKIFKDKQIYGFVNWAFVNQLTQDNYFTTGKINNWCNGNIITHVDLLAKKNVKEIYLWSRKNLAKHLEINQNTKWLRLTKDNKIRNIITKKIRNNKLWVQ